MRKTILALSLLSMFAFSGAQADATNPFIVAAADKDNVAMSGKKKDGKCSGDKMKKSSSCTGKKMKKDGKCTGGKCTGKK